jgi:hypothetical protein
MHGRLTSPPQPEVGGWGRGRLSLLWTFFEALSSNNISTWCDSLYRRKMCLLGFLGDELFGALNKLSQTATSRGRAPLPLCHHWNVYGSIDADLTTVLNSPECLGMTQGHDLQPRFPGLSPLLEEFLAVLDYTSLFHDPMVAQSIVLWNLGPHGFDQSGLHIDRIFAHTSMQSKLWERLTAWIRKHYEDKIVLLGDLNSTSEVLTTHEIVWQDIGRRRPRVRAEYSNASLRALLLPGGLRWKVAQRRNCTPPLFDP